MKDEQEVKPKSEWFEGYCIVLGVVLAGQILMTGDDVGLAALLVFPILGIVILILSALIYALFKGLLLLFNMLRLFKLDPALAKYPVAAVWTAWSVYLFIDMWGAK